MGPGRKKEVNREKGKTIATGGDVSKRGLPGRGRARPTEGIRGRGETFTTRGRDATQCGTLRSQTGLGSAAGNLKAESKPTTVSRRATPAPPTIAKTKAAR